MKTNSTTVCMRCEVCNEPAEFACSGCNSAWYCSKMCEKDNWREHGHRKHCMSTQLNALALNTIVMGLKMLYNRQKVRASLGCLDLLVTYHGEMFDTDWVPSLVVENVYGEHGEWEDNDAGLEVVWVPAKVDGMFKVVVVVQVECARLPTAMSFEGQLIGVPV